MSDIFKSTLQKIILISLVLVAFWIIKPDLNTNNHLSSYPTPVPSWHESESLTQAISEIGNIVCITTTFCEGIGLNTNGDGVALNFNGLTWQEQTLPPGDSLSSITCVSTTFCEANGQNSSANSVALNFNGSTWQEQTLPTGDIIGTITCVTTSFCEATAINSSGDRVLNFNGLTWQEQTLPNGDSLNFNSSIFCLSTNFCVTTGYQFLGNSAPFLFNGLTWQEQTLPNGDSVNSITCVTTSFCEASGQSSNGQGFALNFNGLTWQEQTLPTGDSINSITCVTTSFCEASGQSSIGQGLALNFNGSTWQEQTLPTGDSVNSITCVTTSFCEASGQNSSANSVALNFNGLAWQEQTLPTGDSVNSIICVSTTFCEGSGQNASGNSVALNFNGLTWQEQTLPTSLIYFNLSNCISNSFCEATGQDNSGNSVALNFNGLTWQEQTLPNGDSVNSITCVTTSFCEASGQNSSANSVALNFNGLAWQEQTLPPGDSINSITCVTLTFCAATSSSQSNSLILIYSISPPIVSSLSPSTITGNGPTSVDIIGKNFSGVTSVQFGSNPLQTYTIVSDTLIVLNASQEFGSNYITLTSPSGTSLPNPGSLLVFPPSKEPFNAINPTRICDTRPVQPGVASNQCNLHQTGVLQTNVPIEVNVLGSYGVPLSATAVVITLTATDTILNGYLSVSSTSQNFPNTSSLNFENGQNASNTITVATVNLNGFFITAENGETAVVVDLLGYYGPNTNSSGYFVPTSPARICDTRPLQLGVSANQCNNLASGPIRQGATLTLKVDGNGGIPSTGVEAVVLNVTAINPTSSGYLTLYPANVSQPATSNLNFTQGEIIPSSVIVDVPSNGDITIFNYLDAPNSSTSETNIAVDTEGYFTDGSSIPTNGGLYTPVTFDRICDTRPVQNQVVVNQCNNNGAGGTLSPNTNISIATPPYSSQPIIAILANVTAVNATTSSYVTVFSGSSLPTTSNLNFVQNDVVANSTYTMLSPTNSFNIYNYAGNVDIVVDVEGCYS